MGGLVRRPAPEPPRAAGPGFRAGLSPRPRGERAQSGLVGSEHWSVARAGWAERHRDRPGPGPMSLHPVWLARTRGCTVTCKLPPKQCNEPVLKCQKGKHLGTRRPSQVEESKKLRMKWAGPQRNARGFLASA